LKSISKPPATTLLVMEAFCVILKEPATKVIDQQNKKGNISFKL
jgi:hypothetical protein